MNNSISGYTITEKGEVLKMMNELFSRMQYEPSVFLVGNKYETLKSYVLDYAWNLIVTTNCEVNLASALKNDKRSVRDIINKNDMQANLLDRKNLHVIRLFGESYPKEIMDELDSEDVSDQAVSMLARVAEIIKRNGIILIEDFEESFFHIRNSERHLEAYTIIKNRSMCSIVKNRISIYWRWKVKV